MTILEKWKLPLILMETWIIFVVWLLISQLVNVAETVTGILKYYFLQINAIKFAKYML